MEIILLLKRLVKVSINASELIMTSKYVEIESLIERISLCEDILRYCNLNEKDENMIEESIIRFEQKINEK